MLIETDYIISVQLDHTYQDIIDCTVEIAEYVVDHDNWQKPILPQEPGCSELEFVPERFDWQENFWLCSNQKHDGNTTMIHLSNP